MIPNKIASAACSAVTGRIFGSGGAPRHVWVHVERRQWSSWHLRFGRRSQVHRREHNLAACIQAIMFCREAHDGANLGLQLSPCTGHGRFKIMI